MKSIMVEAIGATEQIEESFVVEAKSEWLYGVAYLPVRRAAASRSCLLLNPLDNEANNAVRFYVRMARLLANNQVPVLRFDYRGTGNSSCCFSKISLETLLDDIDRIREFAGSAYGITPTCLVGARFGATLALIYAGRYRKTDELILWDPILDMRREFKTSFVNKTLLNHKMMGDRGEAYSISRRLAEDGVVELSSTLFGQLFYDQLAGFSLPPVADLHISNGLILLLDVPLTARASQVANDLQGRSELTVKRLPIRRRHIGWEAEEFSEASELLSALEQETMTYVTALSSDRLSASFA
ncbi:MAG: alpha/beta hydrolase [Blastocatellia bacterium]